MGTAYFVGLDLGKAQDYTALAVIEQVTGAGNPLAAPCRLRHLHRIPLGTPYSEIASP